MFVSPSVTRIASTKLESHQGRPVVEHWMSLEGMPGNDPEHLVEFAGRTCYESYGRPREATGDTHKYIQRTVHEQHHSSILEHASVSYFVTGVSRSLLAELTRHRHLSFSVRSQRFVDESDSPMVLPPALRQASEDSRIRLAGVGSYTQQTYLDIVEELEEAGYPRKQAREAARSVLPNMAEVRMVVSGNLRAWLDLIPKRVAPGADAEIRQVVSMIQEDLHEYAPSVFQAPTLS